MHLKAESEKYSDTVQQDCRLDIEDKTVRAKPVRLFAVRIRDQFRFIAAIESPNDQDSMITDLSELHSPRWNSRCQEVWLEK